MEIIDYDEVLNIKTWGAHTLYYDSIHYNRYEATSYDGLKAFFDKYKLNEDDNVVDFGCGKGRLNFFMNYLFNCNVTGIEMDSQLFKEAMDNKTSYLEAHNKDQNKINFVNCYAEEYKIKPQDNKFYFFNPFSVEIFAKVIGNILDSLEENERPIELILYYPSEEYRYYLDNLTFFVLKEEIKFDYMYEYDEREVFLVYEVSYMRK